MMVFLTRLIQARFYIDTIIVVYRDIILVDFSQFSAQSKSVCCRSISALLAGGTMTTYSQILVAVDASDESLQVLHAARLFAGSGTGVIVLHVAQHPVTIYGQAQSLHPHVNENQIRESLFARLVECVEQVGFNRDSIRIHFGEAVDEIVSAARAVSAQLIILGSHARGGIQLLLGATANGVLHHAPCDILAVRIREAQGL
jgi:universal stress protein A